MKNLATFSAFALLFVGIYADTDWWKTMSLYQIYPRSFKDSNGDGIGDLKGITSKLQHLVDSGINAFWLSPIYPSPMVDFGYDISNFVAIDPKYGTMTDFEELVAEAHNLSLKVIMDFVPNHSSDQHDWFKKSVQKIEPYANYYTWHEGKIVNGSRMPPNNWISMFRGPAWTWNEQRQAYYLHQFAPQQPDLNFRNEVLVEEMKNVLRFWMKKGVDGFRIDAVPHIMEDINLKDEPLSGNSNDPDDYGYLNHIYTNSLPESYEMISQWRKVVDQFEKRIIVVEAYANISMTMKYYRYGAHFPFNFGMIVSVNGYSNAKAFKNLIDTWLENLPKDCVSNWVAGNHDQSRLVSRYGAQFAPAITTMVQLLPGVAVTYNGEEIGMENTTLTWEETMDPQGCNAGKENFVWASRDPERTPFQWDDTVSAGFSTNPKPWLRVNDNYKILNLDAEKKADKSYYKTFLKLSEMRKWPVMKTGSITTKLYDNDVFAFSRDLENQKSVYVVINFSIEPQEVDLRQFENIPSRVKIYHTTSENDYKFHDGATERTMQVPERSATIFIDAD